MRLSLLPIFILPASVLAIPIPVIVPERTSPLREQYSIPSPITDLAISSAFIKAAANKGFADRVREYVYKHSDCVPEKPCGLINIDIPNPQNGRVWINGKEVFVKGDRVSAKGGVLNTNGKSTLSILTTERGKDFDDDEEL